MKSIMMILHISFVNVNIQSSDPFIFYFGSHLHSFFHKSEMFNFEVPSLMVGTLDSLIVSLFPNTLIWSFCISI